MFVCVCVGGWEEEGGSKEVGGGGGGWGVRRGVVFGVGGRWSLLRKRVFLQRGKGGRGSSASAATKVGQRSSGRPQRLLPPSSSNFLRKEGFV